MNYELLIFIGGVLHFGILTAGALVPKVLDWKKSLLKLDRLSREIVWVHGASIVMVVIGFGVLSVVFPHELTAGTPLARGLCSFIGVFWATRLCVQLFAFNAKAYLTNPLLTVGYHGLTVVFTYHTLVYSSVALGLA